ncbi:MAG: hypothetical protein BGO77_05365 [Caedibacter sp. 37-49]|nr:MAG: hypothetical protein BGO77_05365 [Caedibacter sp. 37-49]
MNFRKNVLLLTALNLTVINGPLKAVSEFDRLEISNKPKITARCEYTPNKTLRIKFSYQDIQEINQTKSWPYRIAKAGAKVVGAIASPILFEAPLSKYALDSVETAVFSATGSQWLAKSARLGASETVFPVVRDSTAIVGFRSPDVLEEGVKATEKPSSKNIFNLAKEVLETGVKLITTQVADYYLNTPITTISANTAYYGVLFFTGDNVLASASFKGVENFMYYTGTSNLIAKVIGYTVPDLVSGSLNVVKSWWNGRGW